jgi:hypothetical protein
MRLTEPDRAFLLRRVYEGLAARGAPAKKSDFFDNLSLRAAARAQAPPASDDGGASEPAADEPPVAQERSLLEAAAELAVDELVLVRLSEAFPLIERVVIERDNSAFEELLRKLEEKLKIRGILYKCGRDPEREYPALWSKIWEALPKWDGRDFFAYVARLVRNDCIDHLKRRKKAPGEIPDEAADRRPTFKTEVKAQNRDALDHVLSVIEDLEGEGDLAPIDGVIFALLTSGRSVQDIAGALAGPGPEAFAKAAKALAAKKLDARSALALRYLLDELEPDEVAVLSSLKREALDQARKAFAPLLATEKKPRKDRVAGPSDALLIARSLAREGISAADAEKARTLTTNAINLRINRARLKVWMALCDRAYETLRRRGDVDEVDLAIVQHRCTAEAGAWCHMYKDRTCKRERAPEEIARRAGLDLTREQAERRVDGLREKILDGLGRVFPDYDSCLNERKPDRS